LTKNRDKRKITLLVRIKKAKKEVTVYKNSTDVPFGLDLTTYFNKMS